MQTKTKTPDLVIRTLGLQDYQTTWEAMRHFTDTRTEDTCDELWLLEHPPVFTLGQNGKHEHIINPYHIPVVPVDRGGQVTYHGPGQLVGYPLINLRRRDLGVRALVSALEQTLINTLADFNISALAKPDAPGVYVENAKIASIGLRIRKACSYHGFAFNVAMDLTPFQWINPCGFVGLKMIQCQDLGAPAKTEALIAPVARHFCAILGYQHPHFTTEGLNSDDSSHTKP